MKRKEKLFFKKLEEESKDNPMVRIQAAADYICGLIRQAVTNEKGTQADMWCYMLAAMTGVSVAATVKESDKELLIENFNNPMYMPLTKIESEVGIFWIGDSLNKFIYNSPLSVWNIVMTIYSLKHGKENRPDLQKMIGDNAGNMGKKDVKVWNGMYNPYKEFPSARDTYKSLRNKLEPYKLAGEEYPSVFALALGKVIISVEDVFPKGYNCLEMSMETTMFYAHMDFE